MAGANATTDERPPTGEMVAAIRIPARSKPIEEVIGILRSVVGPSLAQLSCGECGVVIDAVEGRYVLFHERWSSFQDFERDVRSALYERVLAALDMASEPPQERVAAIKERHRCWCPGVKGDRLSPVVQFPEESPCAVPLLL